MHLKYLMVENQFKLKLVTDINMQINPREVEQEYEDWLALLKARKAEDLLKDPINIWIEAWSIATIKANLSNGNQTNH